MKGSGNNEASSYMGRGIVVGGKGNLKRKKKERREEER